jgi:hypothetical protein
VDQLVAALGEILGKLTVADLFMKGLATEANGALLLIH